MSSNLTNKQDMMSQSVTQSTPSATSGRLKVDVFDSFDELAPMQQEWDSFIEAVGAEIFLTYDWCRIWWKYYGKNRDLKVFVFRSGNELVGIIPLFFEEIWLGPVSVRAAKIVGTDFTINTVSPPIRPTALEPVVQELLTKLCSDYKWDIIHIGPLSGMYQAADLIYTCSKSLDNSYSIQEKISGFQVYVTLGDNWEEYLKGLSKKMQRNIKHSYRDISKIDCDKPQVLAANIAEFHNCEEIFNNFVQMHQQHWQKLGKLGHFADWPVATEFHCEMAAAQLKHDRLRLMELKIGNYALGYAYDYKFGNKYYAFLDARTPLGKIPGSTSNISLGTIIWNEEVKKALEGKTKHIDMMPGNDEYKLRLGGTALHIRNIYIFPKRPLILILRISLFRALAWLLDLCYYRIWFCRLADRLPFKRKPLWKIWIKTRSFSRLKA
jgi:CelD/BcsL family acetyltransferase involved in cellulose biosynthesis